LSNLQEWPPAQIMLYSLAPMMVPIITVLLLRINLSEGISTQSGTGYCIGYVSYPIQSQRSTRPNKTSKKLYHSASNPE
jgi:hypothetical protein